MMSSISIMISNTSSNSAIKVICPTESHSGMELYKSSSFKALSSIEKVLIKKTDSPSKELVKNNMEDINCEKVKQFLLDTGMWTFLKQRPFSKVRRHELVYFQTRPQPHDLSKKSYHFFLYF